MIKLTIASALIAIGALSISGCDVKKTQEGNITVPKYDVQKTQEGSVTPPKYDVTAPDVKVSTVEKTITVPKVEVTPAKDK